MLGHVVTVYRAQHWWYSSFSKQFLQNFVPNLFVFCISMAKLCQISEHQLNKTNANATSEWIKEIYHSVISYLLYYAFDCNAGTIWLYIFKFGNFATIASDELASVTYIRDASKLTDHPWSEDENEHLHPQSRKCFSWSKCSTNYANSCTAVFF